MPKNLSQKHLNLPTYGIIQLVTYGGEKWHQKWLTKVLKEIHLDPKVLI